MEILALSGFARSGKDEAAKVLVEEFGFQQVAFADKLRDMLYALNPVISHTRWEKKPYLKGYSSQNPNCDTVLLQEVIDTYGWGGYKETPYGTEVRRLLQRLGTEAGRQTLWDTIWIDAALTGLPDDAKVVVSDGRFFNEFDAVRDRGGEVWRIERDGVGPANEHASEMEAVGYQHFTLRIMNDGSLESYRETIRACAESYLGVKV